MLQFIHDDFMLDLTHLKVTFNSENIWFKSEINSDYSFPFEIPWEDWVKISNSVHHNSVNGVTRFKGKLYNHGETQEATLKAQEVKGKFITGMIYSGFEGFSVFDKQLKDLPLDNFPVLDIKDHALDVITKNYPDVSHNFPMIHTDKYDPEGDEFRAFEKIINKFSAGNFVEGGLEPGTNLDQIKNIMQPLPYLMHILVKGFEMDGYQLQGDVLNITDFKKALVFRDGDYYDKSTTEELPFKIGISEFVSSSGMVEIDDDGTEVEMVNFLKEITIDKKGDYILFGNIKSLQYKRFRTTTPFLFVTDLEYKIYRIRGGVSTQILYYQKLRDTDLTGARDGYYATVPNRSVDISVSFEVGDILRFEKTEPRRDNLSPVNGAFNALEDYPYVIDMKVVPIRYYYPDGTPILSILDKKEVDLRKVVPDMSFGELIERLMLWKKLDLKPVGNVVYMNYVRTQLDRNAAVRLSDTEVEEPLMKNNDERTYELSFSDGKTSDVYKYDSVFVSSEGMVVNDYQTKKETIQIYIDALPLPVVKIGDITTAHAFEQESSKLRLVFYNAISLDDDENEAEPVCYENRNMLIPGVYENDYKDWLFFLINSRSYQWDFVISVEKLREITAQSLVYAYNNYHIFTDVEKEKINHLYWKVTAKTEILI